MFTQHLTRYSLIIGISRGLWVIFFTLITFTGTKSTSAQIQSEITPISIDVEGGFGNGESLVSSVSSTGRYILFTSLADNLLMDDKNNNVDLFIHDRMSNQTIRLEESVHYAKLSGDNRFILYQKNDQFGQVFLKDILTGMTTSIPNESWDMFTERGWEVGSLSNDGRYILIKTTDQRFSTYPNVVNIGEFLYDRLTGYLRAIPIPDSLVTTDFRVEKSVISGDGRTVVLLGRVSDIEGGVGQFTVIFYNRVLQQLSMIQLPSSSEEGEVISIPDMDISADGNVFAYMIGRFTNGRTLLRSIIFNRSDGKDVEITHGSIPGIMKDDTYPGLALSGNGEALAVMYTSAPNLETLSLLDLITGNEIIIDQGSLGNFLDISATGDMIAYNKEVNGVAQVFVWDILSERTSSVILAGQVTDTTGHPLALVTIQDDQGHIVRTDGGGKFWITDIKPGIVKLFPSKEGFTFDPEMISINGDADKTDLSFIYAHDETLKEAEKDLGMPYSQNRGINGSFHGYKAGYCTDLVLDAYTWGANFNIQFALEQDFRAHPWHFYRWRDARNAHDMWRYFSYSGQMQPHSNPYQLGDIVFFDWSQDGEIDHVAVVSDVTSGGRPHLMYDATGSIPSNPGGLASELPWEDFHERTVRGFARWSGKYEPVIPTLPSGQVIQMALGGSGLGIILLDSDGNILSKTKNQIPAGKFDDLVWEQSLSVMDPVSQSPFFLVVVFNPGEVALPYQFIAQFIEDGLVTGRIELKNSLQSGQFALYPLLLELDQDDKITIVLGNTNRRIDGSINK